MEHVQRRMWIILAGGVLLALLCVLGWGGVWLWRRSGDQARATEMRIAEQVTPGSQPTSTSGEQPGFSPLQPTGVLTVPVEIPAAGPTQVATPVTSYIPLVPLSPPPLPALTPTGVLTVPAEIPVTGPSQITTTLELAVSGDAMIDSSRPAENFAAAGLQAGWFISGTVRRSLLQFPPLELPAEAEIQQAWLEADLQEGDGQVQAARITSPWQEDALSWQDQPGYNQPLAQPVQAGQPGAVQRWDVSELVKGWLSGAFANEGIAMLEVAGVDGASAYASRESGAPALLRVTYTTGGEQQEAPQVEQAPEVQADRYEGASSPIIVTDSGLGDLTITPGDSDLFRYRAAQYLSRLHLSVVYLPDQGDLVLQASGASLAQGASRLVGQRFTTLSLDSGPLCVGQAFEFQVSGANPAVSSAYSLVVSPEASEGLQPDRSEGNDDASLATPISSTRQTDFVPLLLPSCTSGPNLHTPQDVDVYSFTVQTEAIDAQYTGLYARLVSHFKLEAELYRQGSLLGSDTGDEVEIDLAGAQPGNYLLYVTGSQPTAYSMAVHVYDPQAAPRADELEQWLQGSLGMSAGEALPECRACPALPEWLQVYPWEGSTRLALQENGVRMLEAYEPRVEVSLGGGPRYFVLGGERGGTLRLQLTPLPGSTGQWLDRSGFSAQALDSLGSTFWRVEDTSHQTQVLTSMKPYTTYFLLVNGPPGMRLDLSVFLPSRSYYLPAVSK